MISPFQSTPSGGKATSRRLSSPNFAEFQSTPSGGKATFGVRGLIELRQVSIHAFRGEGDPSDSLSLRFGQRFQSTPSGGKATRSAECGTKRHTRFNPRLPGGRRRPTATVMRSRLPVSIHAFRGEGDVRAPTLPTLDAVSIHAFRGEGDCQPHKNRGKISSFNPRLPGGRRRGINDAGIRAWRRFNPRLPGGRRLWLG